MFKPDTIEDHNLKYCLYKLMCIPISELTCNSHTQLRYPHILSICNFSCRFLVIKMIYKIYLSIINKFLLIFNFKHDIVTTVHEYLKSINQS